jgi:hypothetical protein
VMNPVADAIEAVKGLAAIGAPQGITIGLDFETVINRSYVSSFDAAMIQAGYFVMLYGSTSSLFQNPVTSGGYWAADPTGHPHMYSHPRVVGTQWAIQADIDLDWFYDSVPLWNTKEREMTLEDEIEFSPAVIQQLTDLDPNTFGPDKTATLMTCIAWTTARVAELVVLAQKAEKS